MKKNKTLLYWVLLIFWCSLIYFLSSIPNLKTNLGFWDLVLRKIAHITEYAILYIFAFGAFSNSFKSYPVKTLSAAALVFSVLYASSDEFHQSFVPGRGPSVIDVGIDSIGVLIGYLTSVVSRKSLDICGILH